MKISMTVCTQPESFEAEDEISNALQDDGLRRDLESAIEREIEAIMGWRDLEVHIELTDDVCL